MDEKNNKKYVTIFLVVFIVGIVLVVAKFFVMPKYLREEVKFNRKIITDKKPLFV
jgi:hypothetical protein